MPEIEIIRENDFVSFGKDHATSTNDHKDARRSSNIPSEMRPFCLNPTESEEYFRYLSYDITVLPNGEMQADEKHLPFPLVQEKMLYLYVYRTAEHFATFTAEARAYQVACQEFDEELANHTQLLADLKTKGIHIDELISREKPLSPDPLEEDHIKYTLRNAAGEIVHGKTKIGLSGIKPGMSKRRLITYFNEFKLGILREALKNHPPPFHANTYENIPIETQTQWSEERQQWLANDSEGSWKLVTVPQGSVGLILFHGKKAFIAPGDHLFTAREPNITFIKTESLNQLHFAHGNTQVVRVLPREMVFVQSSRMGADDYKLLTAIPGLHVFELEDAYIAPVIGPCEQDITVTLQNGQVRNLFAKTAQGKAGVLQERDRLVILPPGLTQISPNAFFAGRISVKNSLLPITIKEAKDKNGLSISMQAVVNYRVLQPYFAMKEFGMRYPKMIEQEVIKELSKQVQSLMSMHDIAANKADYTFYEDVIVREVLRSLTESKALQTNQRLVDRAIHLFSSKERSLRSFFTFLDDGTMDKELMNHLRSRLNDGKPLHTQKVWDIINLLKALDAKMDVSSQSLKDRDICSKGLRALILELEKPFSEAVAQSLILSLTNGVLAVDVIKRLHAKISAGPITPDTTVEIISELQRAKVNPHTIFTKFVIVKIKPNDPKVVDQLEQISAQGIKEHTEKNAKPLLIANEKMEWTIKAQQKDIEALEKECEALAQEIETIKTNTQNEIETMLKATPGASRVFAHFLRENKEAFFYTPEGEKEAVLMEESDCLLEI